jgi:hypothetical protein
VWIREHSPPHFHVIGPNIEASFRIDNGHLLDGNVPKHIEARVLHWFNENVLFIKYSWNELRPSNCPAGKILEL